MGALLISVTLVSNVIQKHSLQRNDTTMVGNIVCLADKLSISQLHAETEILNGKGSSTFRCSCTHWFPTSEWMKQGSERFEGYTWEDLPDVVWRSTFSVKNVSVKLIFLLFDFSQNFPQSFPCECEIAVQKMYRIIIE